MAHAMKDDRQRRGYSGKNGRLPTTSLKIGSIMLTERNKQHWGWDIAKRVGVARGTVCQIFQNFAERGWVDCQHETFNNTSQPRVLYSLTANGVVAMRDALIPFQHAPVST